MSDWLQVGARVAAYTTRGFGTPSVRFSTVAKIGKRDIVLANGDRFNVNTRSRRPASAWDPSVQLLQADDPRVAAALARERLVRASHDVIDLMTKWRTTHEDAHRVAALKILSEFPSEAAP